ncbi:MULTISPECIES: GNAT family N-acetyltransferase [unclassified Ruegeria]|uniref:GNAT family N-acetyltransferase n=1 Tax=unclassified Ruegeria TaxID=2625375 RepID=UPI0014896AB5|nr:MULTISPECIES: GNAT family N-acetyltransferase [unclassified Ruegeria]
MTEVIKTQRLVLRRFRREDASRLVDLLNDLDVVRWVTSIPFPFRIEDAENFVTNLASQVYDAFAIEKDGDVIGTVSGGEELGYWIGQRYWGFGYATESARAITTRHFAQSRNNLTVSYHLGNTPSCAVLSKLGFTDTTRSQAVVRSTGETVTLQWMALSRADWEAAQ